ncbi:MAG: hypothetical protein KDK91_34380 [Gammaproteobacteria bacterium]|nr:hypothetical protein [Gammaproteobacteria bacterium]
MTTMDQFSQEVLRATQEKIDQHQVYAVEYTQTPDVLRITFHIRGAGYGQFVNVPLQQLRTTTYAVEQMSNDAVRSFHSMRDRFIRYYPIVQRARLYQVIESLNPMCKYRAHFGYLPNDVIAIEVKTPNLIEYCEFNAITFMSAPKSRMYEAIAQNCPSLKVQIAALLQDQSV